MRRWFAKRFPQIPLNHAVEIDFDDSGITCKRRSGLRDSFSWTELQRVTIRTTDRGPFDDDVFFVIATATNCCWIPSGIAGPLLKRLQQLLGFDNEGVIEAMGCTDHREFICWTRDDSS